MPAPFRLYNTRSRSVEDFQPVVPGKIGIYVCGMTVYDRCHMGHARAMVVFDAFVRYLRFRGWDVNFVRNFTDVDDKIIARAKERGEDPIALAARFIEAFHEDADALGLIRPDAEPKVSDTIDDIQALIGSLVDKGNAYVNEGTVWFDVKSMPSYGQLSGQNVDALQSPDTVPGKRHPADFALWKAVKPGEPSWDSPWGPGRPGWHIECSAMSMGCIGPTLDIHGGGLDLVFPHHENEVAQSEAHTHETYANYWMHNGMLTMASGQKMGKSLGNVWNVQNALKEYPAEAIRLYYLGALYRSPLPWGDDALSDALGSLCRLYEAREVAEAMRGEEDGRASHLTSAKMRRRSSRCPRASRNASWPRWTTTSTRPRRWLRSSNSFVRSTASATTRRPRSAAAPSSPVHSRHSIWSLRPSVSSPCRSRTSRMRSS